MEKNHSNKNFGKIFALGNTFRTCAFWTFVCKLNFQRRFRMSSAELRRGAKLAGASKKRCSNGLCIEFLRAMLLKIEGVSVWRRWAHKITAFNGGFQVLVAVYLFNSYLCTFSLQSALALGGSLKKHEIFGWPTFPATPPPPSPALPSTTVFWLWK